jgi:hypothetical protein
MTPEELERTVTELAWEDVSYQRPLTIDPGRVKG